MRVEPGVVAWGVLAGGIAAYDAWAIHNDKQTLTRAYHEGLEHPFWRYLCIGALGATALHLTKAIPPELDIFYITTQG